PFNVEAYKGKQMLLEGTKTRSALQTGYFDTGFKRIMLRAVIVVAEISLASGACSHYGTFAGPVEAFSPVVAKPLNKATPAGRNIFTVPPKRGTGYGSTDQVQHRSKCMGSAFHLNMHPRALFDLNPYHTDRPLAPHRDRPESKRHVTPFRPSNPPKKVRGRATNPENEESLKGTTSWSHHSRLKRRHLGVTIVA
ncbi:PREDICTED: UPF0602 protein C4orf47 homolog, partial [Priapulus caudatus]|uniref:Cilia-and flagella-associated protein 96 n=1 Tax=Priapulus caudatus TaxID=37621 RepID=A0ABM1F305_PRICU